MPTATLDSSQRTHRSGATDMQRVHEMPFGATVLESGQGVRFRLWAPGADAMRLRLVGDNNANGATERDLPMQSLPGGWHEATVAEARPGTRYRYLTPGGLAVPDPASRWNPD